MRTIAIATLIVLCACDDHGKGGGAACIHNGTAHLVGETFPAGDGCNSCTCSASGGVDCTVSSCIDGGVPDPTSCRRSSGCPVGPACGNFCCGLGERCTNGVCHCATGPACNSDSGDSCQPVGPTGVDQCGALCCGGTGVCPG